jgi:D-arabinose 1-dehydrogenase-like Zn-dependent alcohol dehydrogenase
VSANVDYKLILETLKVDGRFVMVGIPEEKLQIPAPVLIGNRVSMSGSAIGGRKQITEMLDFCSKHNITATVQVHSSHTNTHTHTRTHTLSFVCLCVCVCIVESVSVYFTLMMLR